MQEREKSLYGVFIALNTSSFLLKYGYSVQYCLQHKLPIALSLKSNKMICFIFFISL